MRCAGISRSSASRRQGHQPRRRVARVAERDGICRKRPERWPSCSPPIRRARSIDRRRGERIAAANRRSPTGQLLDRVPGVGPLIASVIAASVPDPGVQVGTRLRGLAGADAKAELERRQGEARRHHQAGQSIHSQDAGCRLHRRCASPANAKALSPTGSPRCGRESRSAWSRWRSPTSWRRIRWAIMTTGEDFRQEMFATA